MPIAKASTGAGFGGLARYLLTGKDGKNPERVAWAAKLNLGNTPVENVAARMKQVASRNVRTKKPVYHFTISWHAEDKPTPDQMLSATDRVLRDLGLREHQVLVVAHKDTLSPHVHVMVNRVNQYTNKTWHTSYDWRRLDASMRNLEHEWGWRRVNRPQLGSSLAPPGHYENLQRKALEPMLTARNWPALERMLEEKGLSLRARGRGLVVTDGEHHIKASQVDRSVSRAKLEERFGLTYREWRNQVKEIRKLAKKHRNLTHGAAGKSAPHLPKQLNPLAAKAKVQQIQSKAQTLEHALEGRGDPQVIERQLLRYATRLGFQVLRRISPQAALIIDAARAAKRVLDRERGGR